MYNSQVEEINDSLKKTGKAIISIGCSFVQGQGAINDTLYDNFEWEYKGEGASLKPTLTDKDVKRILKQYPATKKAKDGSIDFTFLEYANSFVNILCNRYFNHTYTPINLGLRGCGNRGSIKELYFHPDIRWTLAKEVIVVYMPSGLERFDFINDTCDDHFRWVCMWPHYESMEPSDRRTLWEGYGKNLWSEKFGVLEQIGHVQELLSWCTAHNNAKLIITPGFDKRYDKDYFEYILKQDVRRADDYNNTIPVELKPSWDPKHSRKLLNQFPWGLMFSPANKKTFAELALSQEPDIEDRTDYYFQFLGNRSPNGWITPCAHPGEKAHDLFAKYLHNHILSLQ